MAGKLTDFMLKLAEDPRALAEFQRDPEKTISGSDLSSAERTLLHGGNPTKIRDAVVQDMGSRISDSADSVVVITLVWVRSSQLDFGNDVNVRFNEVAQRLRTRQR